MLEFYPLPTNLSHGTGVYTQHPNHGAERFCSGNALSSTGAGININTAPLNTNHHHNHSGHNTGSCEHPQKQLNNASPTHATCAPNNRSQSNTPTAAATCTTSTSISAATSASVSAASSISLASNAVDAAVAAAAAAAAAAAVNEKSSVVNSCAALSSSSAAAAAAAAAAFACSPASRSVMIPTSLSASCSSSPSSLSSSATAAAILAPTSVAATGELSAECSGRTEVGHVKCEKNYEICEGCGQKIHDRYLMNVGESNWHEHCLSCCYCGIQLYNTCYVRNAKLYCKLDYDRLFGIKCTGCCHPILPQELVMRPIPNYIFHLPCFICYICRIPLQKGEQFLLRDGQLFCCRHDLEKEMYLATAQHCGFVGLDDDDLMRPRDGRRGPKRPRTILTSQQRKQFKASFDQSPKPCRKVREALAKDTGLSVRVVQVWFQNQRAKMKKIQRKAKNGGNNGGGANSRGSDDKDMNKDEKDIKQECGALGALESNYLSLNDSGFASQPLNPNLPFSPDDYPPNSNDSFCSSDLSLDGSNFDQLDDDTDSLSLNNLELQSTSSSGNQHSNPHDIIANLSTGLANPIDKLYLMQNSYFSADQ